MLNESKVVALKMQVVSHFCLWLVSLVQGLRATHVVLGSYLVPVCIVLVTPGLEGLTSVLEDLSETI